MRAGSLLLNWDSQSEKGALNLTRLAEPTEEGRAVNAGFSATGS